MSWVIEHLHRDGSVLARVVTKGHELRLGRALDNDLVLDDAHCAPYHAVLQVDGMGRAELRDLGTLNALRTTRSLGRSQRHAVLAVQHDQKIELGATTIRVRSADSALAPEKLLSVGIVWPLALVALTLVIGHLGWDMWLSDVTSDSPKYLSTLTAFAVGLTVWSAAYGLLGRIMGGGDRLFTHLLIVCSGYLSAVLLNNTLDLLAYSFYWLWPLRISTAVGIVVVALTVRAHLRVADPRHWPLTRWAVALGALLAIGIPIGQTWITSQRLTHIQVMNLIEHPATRLATPSSIASFMESTASLKDRVEQQRRLDTADDTSVANDD